MGYVAGPDTSAWSGSRGFQQGKFNISPAVGRHSFLPVSTSECLLCATATIKLCDIPWFDPVALMSLNEDTDTKSWSQRILTDKDRMISCLNSYKCHQKNYITAICYQTQVMQLHKKNSNFTDYYQSFNEQNKIFFTTANVKTVILNGAKSVKMTKCDICTELKNNKNCTAA